MKKFLISLLVVLGGLCAYAANWERISDKIYLDTSGIMSSGKTGSVYSFWTKELNDGGEDFVLSEKKYSQKVWYDMVRYSIDCSSRKFKIEEVLIYGLQHNLMGIDSSAADGWHVIPPQSIAEDYLELVCKFKPQLQTGEVGAEGVEQPKKDIPGKLSFTEINPETPAIRTREPKPEVRELTQADLDSYMKNLQAKINGNWKRPDCDKSLKVTLIFSISKDGTLVTLSEFKGSGNQEFDTAASDAIKTSVPFEPLPAGYKHKNMDIQLTFDENIRGFMLSGK